jgi:hypothetical protein
LNPPFDWLRVTTEDLRGPTDAQVLARDYEKPGIHWKVSDLWALDRAL